MLKRGYWGDIANSPFFCFGVSAEPGPDRDALFKVSNRQHVKTAVDVSVYNLTARRPYSSGYPARCSLSDCCFSSRASAHHTTSEASLPHARFSPIHRLPQPSSPAPPLSLSNIPSSPLNAQGAIHELQTGTRYSLPSEEQSADLPGKALIESVAEDDEEGTVGEAAEASSSGGEERVRAGGEAAEGEAGASGSGGAGAGADAGEATEAAAAAASAIASAEHKLSAETVGRFKITFFTGEVEKSVCKNSKLGGLMARQAHP